MTVARRRPEILAPAGDAAALRAAVRAGADAVYFGLLGFNARVRAANFGADELGAAMRYLHEQGVRGYVALNTLVFDDELASLEAAVRACAAAGADAVLVQDLGVARLVRDVAPALPVHASTQMTCTDSAGIALACSLGARRVILPRELSLQEIALLRAQTDAELEVFVHGALCVAYSGQCLTSEAIGGRSANRGACAQACRLPYRLVVDGELRDPDERAYLLSPQDLEASALVPQLVKLGVDALKIEGRMKGPAYVGATVALYRKAVLAAMDEGDAPSVEDRDAALLMFSRGSGPGFLTGVDHRRLVEGRSCDHRGLLAGKLTGVRRAHHKPHLGVQLEARLACGDGILVEGGFAGQGELGGRVWALVVRGARVDRAEAGEHALVWLGPDKRIDGAPAGRRVFKTSDPAREKELQTRLEREPYRVPLDVRVEGRFGEAPVLSATSARGHTARVTGDTSIEPARSAPLTPEALRDQLGRLGDTPFALGELSVELPGGAMLPVSSLNRARRALAGALLASRGRSWATTDTTHREVAGIPERPPPLRGLFVLCRAPGQAEAALTAGADGVYLDFLDLAGAGDAVRALRARACPGRAGASADPQARRGEDRPRARLARARRHPGAQPRGPSGCDGWRRSCG